MCINREHGDEGRGVCVGDKVEEQQTTDQQRAAWGNTWVEGASTSITRGTRARSSGDMTDPSELNQGW